MSANAGSFDLFSSIRIGAFEAPSRCFFAPINTGFAQDGAPTERLVAFHKLRAGRGIGVSYVGNVAVSPQYRTNENTLFFSPDTREEAWTPLTTAIAGSGSLSGIQLACRASPRQAPRKWKTRNSEEVIEQNAMEITSISTNELDEVVACFAAGAKMAASFGFHVLQLHAAHGYLLSQFLNPKINRRHDEYGKEPLLLLLRVIGAVRASAPNCALDVRLSIQDSSGFCSDERSLRQEQISSIVAASSVDIISISAGHYELSRSLIYPSERDGADVYLEDVLELCRNHPRVLWNVAGNIRDLSGFRQSFPQNLTVSFGRPLIADPEFVAKWSTGLSHEIRACDWNGKCHYYTRNKPHVSCPISLDLPEPADS